MTRTYTEQPVWTWKCDECGHEQELAREQSGSLGLPSPHEMRDKGWFIAKTFGDKCPECVSKSSALHDEVVVLAPRCRACAGPFDLSELTEDDDVPLCPPHFNDWIFRFLGADDAPPCRTHLVEESHDYPEEARDGRE